MNEATHTAKYKVIHNRLTGGIPFATSTAIARIIALADALEITQEEAIDRASVPLKEFMLRNTESSSLTLFCDLAGVDKPATDEEAMELSMRVIIPSYMTSELKAAFQIGFFLYIPFMLIDIVVSSTLMSMGMIMLPPAMISMPFKLLLFITVDGWQLLFSTLAQGFR